VPKGGLEVASGPAGVVSYAAIGYFGDERASVATVVLHLAQGAANVAGTAVEACPLTGDAAFSPAYGAPLSEGPAYDCATPVPGVPDAAAATIAFNVGSLLHDGHLGLAIVANGTGRLVFAPPDDTTVHLGSSPAPAGTDEAGSVDISVPQLQPLPLDTLPPPAIPSPVGDTHSLGTPSGGRSAPPVLAVTEPANTIGIGSAGVGALVLIAAGVAVLSRTRRAANAERVRAALSGQEA